MVTQKDISAACGVSISAVSKALSDYPDISEDTKCRIRDVAEKMGYHGVKKEVSIKRAHTYTVGLLITEETERKSCENVIQELRKALVRRGYDLVLLSPEREEQNRVERPGYLPRARLYGMEGIFLFSSIQERALFDQTDFRSLRELILGEIPVVAVGCFPASCRCVLPAYDRGIRMLVREIHRRGHRRIAFVYKESLNECGVCSKSIRAALEENRAEVPENYLRCVSSGNAWDAFVQTRDLLQSSRWIGPTCILFSDDLLLEGGSAAIRSCGLRIPENICVAAIRTSELPDYQDFPVLSWRLSPSKIAEAAVEQMFHGMNGRLNGAERIRMIDGILYEEKCTDPARIFQYPEINTGICSKINL